MDFLRNLFGKSNQRSKEPTTPSNNTFINRQRDVEATTKSKFWMCSQCGSKLEKRGGAAMAVFEAGGSLDGTVTCGVCGAKYSLHDVYAGKFDVANGVQYDLLMVICDIDPTDKDAYLASLLNILRIPLSTNAQGVVKQHPDARILDKVFPYAMSYAVTYYRRISLEIDDKSVKYMQFEYPQGTLNIGGYAFWMCGKR